MMRVGSVAWLLVVAPALGCDAVLVLEGDPDAVDRVPEAAVEADGDGDGREADARPDTTDVPVEIADVPADVDAADDAPEADVPLDPCPEEMVAAGPVCIDRYEASRPDATESSPGVDESRATSRVGVIPWFRNPFDAAGFAAFEAACVAAGKHLCRPEEWQAACQGPAGLPFVYGDTFDRETCNCVDTFCDDYCVERGIPAAECDTAADCGYRYYCFRVVPTGVFSDCTNAYGTYDMNGNVWEIVPSTTDPRGFEVRGGAFNCAAASMRVNCTFNAGWLSLNAGFRCCKDR
ncbi:MAG: SUMF1/EgtB/PvdO family nonheme iron enzyme [Deltaproteobacteria bacterium]|nr:SUMF1/EgtB/PvdO family nonheme iron enzyme [Deltaproteobacteria bacterium]